MTVFLDLLGGQEKRRVNTYLHLHMVHVETLDFFKSVVMASVKIQRRFFFFLPLMARIKCNPFITE